VKVLENDTGVDTQEYKMSGREVPFADLPLNSEVPTDRHLSLAAEAAWKPPFQTGVATGIKRRFEYARPLQGNAGVPNPCGPSHRGGCRLRCRQ
jgi:hypothetical protein